MNRFTGVVNLYILIGAGARVSENVAVDGNATTGFSVTPKIRKITCLHSKKISVNGSPNHQ